MLKILHSAGLESIYEDKTGEPAPIVPAPEPVVAEINTVEVNPDINYHDSTAAIDDACTVKAAYAVATDAVKDGVVTNNEKLLIQAISDVGQTTIGVPLVTSQAESLAVDTNAVTNVDNLICNLKEADALPITIGDPVTVMSEELVAGVEDIGLMTSAQQNLRRIAGALEGLEMTVLTDNEKTLAGALVNMAVDAESEPVVAAPLVGSANIDAGKRMRELGALVWTNLEAAIAQLTPTMQALFSSTQGRLSAQRAQLHALQQRAEALADETAATSVAVQPDDRYILSANLSGDGTLMPADNLGDVVKALGAIKLASNAGKITTLINTVYGYTCQPGIVRADVVSFILETLKANYEYGGGWNTFSVYTGGDWGIDFGYWSQSPEFNVTSDLTAYEQYKSRTDRDERGVNFAMPSKADILSAISDFIAATSEPINIDTLTLHESRKACLAQITPDASTERIDAVHEAVDFDCKMTYVLTKAYVYRQSFLLRNIVVLLDNIICHY